MPGRSGLSAPAKPDVVPSDLVRQPSGRGILLGRFSFCSPSNAARHFSSRRIWSKRLELIACRRSIDRVQRQIPKRLLALRAFHFRDFLAVLVTDFLFYPGFLADHESAAGTFVADDVKFVTRVVFVVIE